MTPIVAAVCSVKKPEISVDVLQVESVAQTDLGIHLQGVDTDGTNPSKTTHY